MTQRLAQREIDLQENERQRKAAASEKLRQLDEQIAARSAAAAAVQAALQVATQQLQAQHQAAQEVRTLSPTSLAQHRLAGRASDKKIVQCRLSFSRDVQHPQAALSCQLMLVMILAEHFTAQVTGNLFFCMYTC